MLIRRKTLSIASHPGHTLVHLLDRRYHSHYHGRHVYPRTIFTLDLLLAGALIGFTATLIALLFFNRNNIAKQIEFSATVAPTEIASGAPSTLVLSWHNTSKEELRSAELSLSYPPHFLLQDLVFLNEHIEGNRVRIGSVPPDGQGSIKVRGVMFGDVGGEQTFTSDLAFRYRERNRKGSKSATHTFKPTTSALQIEATVPDIIVSGQVVNGTIRLTNTGPVEFSRVTLTPAESVFDFAINHARAARDERGLWVVNGLEPGSTTELAFTGRAPEQEERTETSWSFRASFTFDDVSYFQGETTHRFTLIPSPLTLEQTIDTLVLTPGGNLSLTGTFRNISDEPLSNITFFLEGDSPFLAGRDGEQTTYDKERKRWSVTGAEMPDTLDPRAEGAFHITVPVRASIPTSSTTQTDRFTASVRIGAEFTILSSGITASVRTPRAELPITTPISLVSFARYSTEQGDQIGRGALPPVVGEETKYWVFWNVSGTTNELTNVEISATPPAYAHSGTKQTVSIGSPVRFDNGNVRWSIDRLPPTFAPGSKTVGIAFEVAIVPSEAHIGKILPLLEHIELTGTDAFTGASVRAFGARVTTDLPNDGMARGLGSVEL